MHEKFRFTIYNHVQLQGTSHVEITNTIIVTTYIDTDITAIFILSGNAPFDLDCRSWCPEDSAIVCDSTAVRAALSN